MTDMMDQAWLWLAKAGGAIAGSAISVAYVLPQDRRDAAIRFAVGVLCGVVFGGVVGVKVVMELDLADSISPSERILIGSAITSLCGWWSIGFILKRLDKKLGKAIENSLRGKA